MRRFCEEDRIYTGLTSRVYDVENESHMRELEEIMTGRQVNFRTCQGYTILDYLNTSLVKISKGAREIAFFEPVIDEMFKYLGCATSVEENYCDLKYIFVQEIEIGYDIFAIEVTFLSDRDGLGWDEKVDYSYEKWENAHERDIDGKFEIAEKYQFIKPRIQSIMPKTMIMNMMS